MVSDLSRSSASSVAISRGRSAGDGNRQNEGGATCRWMAWCRFGNLCSSTTMSGGWRARV
jgi:hypothetical protein